MKNTMVTALILFALSFQSLAADYNKMTITLYFSDQDALHFVTEKRSITLSSGEQIERMVLRELARGPEEKQHLAILSQYVEPLSIMVKQKLAYLNFPREFYLKNRYGSTGELFLVGAIVNSLLELPHINEVQFLVEGKIKEAAFGHCDTERTFKRKVIY